MSRKEAIDYWKQRLAEADENEAEYIKAAIIGLDHELEEDFFIMDRLKGYEPPSAISGLNAWMLDKDLTHCTEAERNRMHRLGFSLVRLMNMGLTRGEVAWVLYGYKHSKKQRGEQNDESGAKTSGT